MGEIESRVVALKRLIADHDGDNVTDDALIDEVDALVPLFYDDIGSIKQISLGSLFDLFLVKVLYIDRGSRKSAVLDYLSGMLARFLWTRELIPLGEQYDFLFSILEQMHEAPRFHNAFEACRQLGDNSLFVTGMFPTAQPNRTWVRRRLRAKTPPDPRFDRGHFIDLGWRYYRLAAEEQLAEVVGQRELLLKLADFFPLHMGALNEISQRYILGFDMDVIADTMLDAFNTCRRTKDARDLETAQKYAALLRVDRKSFARFFRRRPRVPMLGGGRTAGAEPSG